MKIAIISDVHGNFEALQAITDVLDEADVTIALGDWVGYYCQVNEVIEFARAHDITSVAGNHDAFVLGRLPVPDNPAVQFGVAWATDNLSPLNREWLSRLPLTLGLHFDGLDCLFVHGSPRRPLTEYVYENRLADAGLEAFDFDLIAMGHTHRPYSCVIDETRVVNPGSVGQSRDETGVVQAACLDTDDGTVTHLRRAYDTSPVLQMARDAGAGEWIEKHLRT